MDPLHGGREDRLRNLASEYKDHLAALERIVVLENILQFVSDAIMEEQERLNEKILNHIVTMIKEEIGYKRADENEQEGTSTGGPTYEGYIAPP